MIEDLPGFQGGVAIDELIAAAVVLVLAPLLGWFASRLIARRIKRTETITSWGGEEIAIGAIHDVLIVWFAVAGGFIALRILAADGEQGLRVGIADGVEKALVAVLIVSATVVVARVVTDLVKLYSLRTQGTTRSSSIFVVIARIVVVLIGFLVLLQTFGVSITPLLTALGVGGLAVALALQDTLSNFFAGLQLLATKKVKPGDFVKLENGEQGYVADIDWRHTSIRQLPNNMILVPNATLATSMVTNFYYPEQELSILVQVGVSYDSDLEHVERVTLDVAREVLRNVEGGVGAFEPLVRFHTFNDSSIDCTVVLRAREFTDQFLLKHEFVKRLHRRYRDEGIVIPFPIRTIDWPGFPGDGQAKSTTRQPQRRDPGVRAHATETD